MSDTKKQLGKYLGDQLALERHVHQAVHRQKGDDRLGEYAEAHRLVTKIDAVLEGHLQSLESHLQALDGDSVGKTVLEGVTAFAGAVAGLYDKVRNDPVSRMLRDDYTALSMVAVSATMLHTTGLALDDTRTADLALEVLSDVAPLIVELSEVVPLVVARELAKEGKAVRPEVGAASVQATQKVWSPSHATV